MGKIVLYLVDGTLLHVPLDKERITIGRRADNDVCLPYPAVSGEHAALVTILADSFLEDLGSTNGTLVNGKSATKHFLKDRDHIDIGRQRLIYFVDNDARAEPLPPDIVHGQMRGLSDRVESVHNAVSVPLPRVLGTGAALQRPAPLTEDIEREIASAPVRQSIERTRAADITSLALPNAPPQINGTVVTDGLGVPAVPPSDAAPVAGVAAAASDKLVVGVSTARVAPSSSETKRVTGPVATQPKPEAVPAALTVAVAAAAAAPAVAAVSAPIVPSVRVLSGPSTGRSVPFPNDQLSVGRVGAQVAVLRKSGNGYLLVPVEGDEPPRINGAPVAAEGSPLHPGDTFEVAGVRLELSAGS